MSNSSPAPAGEVAAKLTEGAWRGATAVMPYSARARDGAPVSAPVAWEELDGITTAATYSIRDADVLLERAASKLLAGWGEAKQCLPDA